MNRRYVAACPPLSGVPRQLWPSRAYHVDEPCDCVVGEAFRGFAPDILSPPNQHCLLSRWDGTDKHLAPLPSQLALYAMLTAKFTIYNCVLSIFLRPHSAVCLGATPCDTWMDELLIPVDSDRSARLKTQMPGRWTSTSRLCQGSGPHDTLTGKFTTYYFPFSSAHTVPFAWEAKPCKFSVSRLWP